MDEKQGMELGHLPYKRATFGDYVGVRGLEEHGKQEWQRHVADVVKRLIAALEPDEVVLGGGNVKKPDALPVGTQAGDNDNAFRGGFRLWRKSAEGNSSEITTAGGLVSRRRSPYPGELSSDCLIRERPEATAIRFQVTRVLEGFSPGHAEKLRSYF